MKHLILYISLLISLILIGSLNLISAVECNATGDRVINSTTISNGCNILSKGTYVMSGETFYLNGSAELGVINISATGVNLNCNGSTFIGNYSGIAISQFVDNWYFNISNCNIKNYTIGFLSQLGKYQKIHDNNFSYNNVSIHMNTNSNSNLIFNNSFIDDRYRSIGLSNQINTNITYNFFNKTDYYEWDAEYTQSPVGFIYSDSGDRYSIISHNVFIGCQTNQLSLNSKNSTIQYNSFLGLPIPYMDKENKSVFSYRLFYIAGVNNTIQYNNLSQSQYGLIDSGYFNKVQNNRFYSLDVSSRLNGIYNYFYNNTIYNSYNMLDAYYLGLQLSGCVNCSVINNSISNITTGIWLVGSNNTLLEGNTINRMSLAEKILYSVYDMYEPNVALRLSTSYKSWLSILTGFDNRPDRPANTTALLPWNSYNTIIRNNVLTGFDINMFKESSYNVSHDLTDYRYYNLNLYNQTYNSQELYINSSFSNLSHYENIFSTPNYLIGYRGNYSIEYQIYPTYIYLKNYYYEIVNTPVSHENVKIQDSLFYNLTSVYILFSNYSGLSNINGDINITLNPNEWVKIYSDGYCPSLYTYKGTGTCKKNTIISTSADSCEDGYTYLNGECLLDTIDEPETGCPISYVDLGSTCELSITNSCNESSKAFMSYVALLGLIGVIVLIGWFLAYLTGFIDKSQLKDFSIMTAIVTIIVVGFAIIIGLILLQAICQLF